MNQLILKSLNDFGVDEWQSYYSKSIETTVFYQLNFLISFQEASNAEVYISYYEIDNEIVCALPIYKVDGVYSNVKFKGWDNLTIISVEKGISYVNEFMLELISKCKVLQLSNFTENISFDSKQVNLIREKRFNCPYINLSLTPEEIKSGLSKTVKKSLSWNLNKFEKEGFRVVFSRSDELPVEERIKKFDDLLFLHNERASITGISSKFTQPDSIEFQKKLLTTDTQGSIFFLELYSSANELVGSFFGYLNHKQCVHFNSGLSTKEKYKKLSLGLILLFKLIEYMHEKELLLIDLLRGTERYKFHWTSTVNQNSDYIIYDPKSRVNALFLYFKNQSLRFGRRKALSLTVKKLFS